MPRLGAVDVGTNTVRVIVADVDPRSGLRDEHRDLEITRLGRGVDLGRQLSADAIERTAGVVERFVRDALERGAETVRVAGTSALRDAHNSAVFEGAIMRATGLELEILEGEDEGRLAFLGATHELDEGPVLVCDIGGGSTEFVRGVRWMESVWSADVGSVRLRERYMTSDPPTAGEISGARTLVEHELLQVERDVGLVGDETLVGVAGTVTTLAALVLGLDRYDPALVHGSRLTRGAVRAKTDELLSMPVDRVRGLPCMHPARADVIASGALVLREVMDRWAFPEVLVSEHDILDGLLLEAVLGPDAGLPPVPQVG